MRVLKVVGIVVAAVALVATGIGLAVGSGVFLGVAGGTFATVGAIAGVAAGVIGLAGALLAPKPSFSQNGNPQQFQTNPQSGLPYCIGRTAFSGLRAHGATTQSPGYDKQDLLCFAVLLCAAGPIQEVQAFTADTVPVTFQVSDGNADAGTGYQGYMAQRVSLGASGASALSLSLNGAAYPGWGTDYKLNGMAHALWMMRYDTKGDHYSNGPSQPRWLGKWVMVYDPRLDSTYPGGSGSCRALNEATYVWSRNPALHALTWCLGRWQNDRRILGIGAPLASIRVADFVEAANIADANGWGIGGVVWSTDAKWTVLKNMLQACGAVPTMTGAMIGCRTNTPRVSIATITSADLLDALSISVTRSRRERINTIRPRYRSEDHDWEVITGSAVQVSAYVTADGGERAKELDLPYVQSEVGQSGFDGDLHAGQLAAYEIVNAREGGPIAFTTGPKWLGLKNGDCITLDVPEEGLSAVKVLLTSDPVFDPATCKCSFTADTETDSKHAFALGSSTTPPPAFAPTAPDLIPPQPGVGVWTLAKVIGADGQPQLRISGGTATPSWDAALIEYRKVGDPSWIFAGSFRDGGGLTIIIPGVDGATAFEARIAYATSGMIGPWRDLGSVTTDPNGLQILISDAQATADAKRTIFYQPTPPTASESEENDLWINSADGNRTYRRVAGTGVLAIGSGAITLGGSTVSLCWMPVDDQRIGQAILDAAGAQATADGKAEVFTMFTVADPEPVGIGVGDLLVRAYLTPPIVDHWSGSAWEHAATVGAPAGTPVGSTDAVTIEAGGNAANAGVNSNGTIKTDKVLRGSIQVGSVVVPGSAYTSAGISITALDTWTDVQSVTEDLSGAAVMVLASVSLNAQVHSTSGTGGFTIFGLSMRILRGGTVIWSEVNTGAAAVGGTTTASISDVSFAQFLEIPSPGTGVTYTLQAMVYSDPHSATPSLVSATASRRNLITIEANR